MSQSSQSGKHEAFQRKSVVFRLAKWALIVLVLLTGLVAGARFGLPDQWAKGETWLKENLQGPYNTFFMKISKKYVDASDLDGEGKKAWQTRLDTLCATLEGNKGTADQRAKLEQIREQIVDKMQDGVLTRAELDPIGKELDPVLQEVEAVEMKKKQ